MKILEKIAIVWVLTGLSVMAFIFSFIGTPKPAASGVYDYISVADYGATGIGTNDDAMAIQAAINAVASNNGGVVYFPAGIYRIDSPLVLTNQVCLLGEGLRDVPGGSVIKAGANLSSMIHTPTSGKAGSLITIENLTFDGGAAEGQTVTWAMDLGDFQSGRIADVAITNLTGGGIYSYWATSYSNSWVNWFVNLHIEVGGYALRLKSSDQYIHRVHVDGGLGLLEEGYCDDIYRNCVVENCTNGLTVSYPNGNNMHTSIADCSFSHNLNYGLKSDFVKTNFTSYLSIDGCSFAGNGKADVYLGNCANITLHNNDFTTTNPGCGQNIEMTGVMDYNTLTFNRFACSTQTVAGAHSLSASNEFSVSSWDNPDVVPFEIGTILWPSNRSTPLSIPLTNCYNFPIIVAQTVTANGSTPCVTYAANATGSNFQFMIQNWDTNTAHTSAETVNYLAMEKGHHLLKQMNPDRYVSGADCDRFARSHTQMEAEAGYIGGVTQNWVNVVFTNAFSQTPVVFVQRASNNGDVTTVRIKDCSATGFSVMVQEAPLFDGIHYVGDRVNYIAITPGWSDDGDLRVLSGQSVMNHIPAWLMFGDSYMSPLFVAGMQSCNDTNPCVWGWDPKSLEKGGVRVAIEGSGTTNHGPENFGWLVCGIPDVVAPGSGRVLNVKTDYGATGTGHAYEDDTTNIQAALDAAMPGDTVYFPTGGYYISSALKLTKSGITILGDGYGTVGSKIITKNNLNAMVATPNPVSGVRIGKLCFAGESNLGYAVDHALFLSNLTDSVIDRVRFLRLSGDAITVATNSSRIRIRNCLMNFNTGWSISLEGTDCIVESTYCSQSKGVQITGSGHRIVNSHVDRATTAGIYFPDSSVCSNITIRNCFFDLDKAGISLNYNAAHSANIGIESTGFRLNDADIYLHNVTDVLIGSCTFLPSSNPIEASGTVDYLTVIGNVFETPASVPGTNSVSFGNVIP